MSAHLFRPDRLAALLGAGALAFLGAGGVAVAQPHSDAGKQTICHADSDDKKPYVVNTPAKDGDLSGHADHTGPLWNDTLKADHAAWGDVIPPFDYTDKGVPQHFPGLNWTEDGQAIFANGCAIPEPVVLSLAVTKTNDANDDGTFSDSETATAAGRDVDFELTVTNTSASPIVLDTLVDKVGATPIAFDCTPSIIGTNLAPGASTTCHATETAYSPADGDSTTNDATVTGHQGPTQACDATDYECVTGENHGNTVSAHDPSTVATAVPPTTPVPPALSLTIDKTNDADNDGAYSDSETAAAAGQDVKYRVVITNTSAVTVNVDSLTDALGDAAPAAVTCATPLPATLAANASATCDFTLAASSPAAGDSVTDVATATISDPDDPTSTESGSDDSTVDTADTTGTEGGGTVTTPGTTTTEGGGEFTGGGGTVTLPFTGLPVGVLLGSAAGMVALGAWLSYAGRARRA